MSLQASEWRVPEQPVLLDEVMAAFAYVEMDEVMTSPRGLLVEQNVASALELVQCAYVIESGRITISGSAKELDSNDEVRAILEFKESRK